jgi:hypothetical protein
LSAVFTSDEQKELSCAGCLTNIFRKLENIEKQNNGKWFQCSDGHILCQECYDRLGGESAPCPCCKLPLGTIRNRLAEIMCRKAHFFSKAGIEASESFSDSWKENIRGNDGPQPFPAPPSLYHQFKTDSNLLFSDCFNRPRNARSSNRKHNVHGYNFKAPNPEASIQSSGTGPLCIFKSQYNSHTRYLKHRKCRNCKRAKRTRVSFCGGSQGAR